ncbi:hypothetical protein EVA_09891 [gut metagenome]|uniref:Uncharacterized protein n=1 Tax=gut metagenome TaxID=749906 RepID=J9GJ14_9ZZZZ
MPIPVNPAAMSCQPTGKRLTELGTLMKERHPAVYQYTSKQLEQMKGLVGSVFVQE